MDKRGGILGYATKDRIKSLSFVYALPGFVLEKKEGAYDESRSSHYRASGLSYYFRTKSEVSAYNIIKREFLRDAMAEKGSAKTLCDKNIQTEEGIRAFLKKPGLKIKDKAAFAERLLRLFTEKLFLPVIRSEMEYQNYGTAKPVLKTWKKDRHIIWLSGATREFENRNKHIKNKDKENLSWETLILKGIPCIVTTKYKPIFRKIHEYARLTHLNLFEHNAAKFIDKEEDRSYPIEQKSENKRKIKTLRIPGYILTAATAPESIFLCKNPQTLDKDMLRFIDAWYFSKIHSMEIDKKNLRLRDNSTPIFVVHHDLINEKNRAILNLPQVLLC